MKVLSATTTTLLVALLAAVLAHNVAPSTATAAATPAPADGGWITLSPKERGRTKEEQAALDAKKMSTGTMLAVCGSITGAVALGGVALCIAEKKRRAALDTY
ncbi:hypothetical protein ACHHYP_08196 [Achlya hypogyna]|uniref:Secreted protein n=1 Tax=Achlya hypogyna TaxID=1202772 RepID=A0A1V9YPQ4_ACHHY|nr:hypothetical protein ACHHYP_08196 [Achlya hypogyna]